MTELLPFEDEFRRWIEERAMAWERLELPDSHGGSTAGYRFTPSASSGRAVLALHGAGNDALFAWVGLFKQLLERGAEIFTFDLPGHGRLSTTRFALAAAVEAVRSALATCAGGRPGVSVHAVGVSLGGSLLLHALPEIQDRLASASLMVAPLRIHLGPRTVARELGLRTWATLWREREHYGWTGLIPSFGRFKRDLYPLRWATPPPPGAFGYVRGLNAALDEMQLERGAASVRLPVLLVYGERDLVVPVEQGERLARALPRNEFFRVPLGTHLSTPLDERAIARVLAWVDVHR